MLQPNFHANSLQVQHDQQLWGRRTQRRAEASRPAWGPLPQQQQNHGGRRGGRPACQRGGRALGAAGPHTRNVFVRSVCLRDLPPSQTSASAKLPPKLKAPCVHVLIALLGSACSPQIISSLLVPIPRNYIAPISCRIRVDLLVVQFRPTANLHLTRCVVSARPPRRRHSGYMTTRLVSGPLQPWRIGCCPPLLGCAPSGRSYPSRLRLGPDGSGGLDGRRRAAAAAAESGDGRVVEHRRIGRVRASSGWPAYDPHTGVRACCSSRRGLLGRAVAHWPTALHFSRCCSPTLPPPAKPQWWGSMRVQMIFEAPSQTTVNGTLLQF